MKNSIELNLLRMGSSGRFLYMVYKDETTGYIKRGNFLYVNFAVVP